MEILTTEPEINGSSEQFTVNGISTGKAFITANTIESSLEEVKSRHLVPVFVKDNEPVISQADFIENTMEIVKDVFHGETILRPAVRLSHEIKGRVPEAKDKPAKDLLEHERTVYYERCAFIIEVPSISDDIDGNTLSLTVGGIKSYSQDNLYNRHGADQHFKLFIGFKNTVCCNMCIWSDGFAGDLKVKSVEQLRAYIYSIFSNYSATNHLQALARFTSYSLSEQQFAILIGRCRMYNHLPPVMKREMKPLSFGDTQLGAVVRDYYRDDSFCRDSKGHISLWKLYNLFTGTNKSAYIDSFLERTVNAYQFAEGLRLALEGGYNNWFLS